MNELLERLLQESSVNEVDAKKVLRTALATGLIGGAALGLGYRKGLQHRKVEKPPAPAREEQPEEELIVDVDTIAKIESSNNPRAVNRRTGARGLCQIMKPTWEECTRMMRKDWSWEEAFDPEKNRAVADFYLNRRIPQMLRYFKIPDTLETRLASYNWGIGNVKRAYSKYGKDFLSVAPRETKNYVKKYERLK